MNKTDENPHEITKSLKVNNMLEITYPISGKARIEPSLPFSQVHIILPCDAGVAIQAIPQNTARTSDRQKCDITGSQNNTSDHSLTAGHVRQCERDNQASKRVSRISF